ncbi:hypothetical protein PR048_033222 [Dryococelus australis]|uniref:C2H2-type domain-containing protein n=1 Tax=Dryococelus australis TaxID=614101 RepID=A0ABQ9FZN4_9NEOP|nr:hypothetical protein PR048_033222 [Dryococelus australis]
MPVQHDPNSTVQHGVYSCLNPLSLPASHIVRMFNRTYTLKCDNRSWLTGTWAISLHLPPRLWLACQEFCRPVIETMSGEEPPGTKVECYSEENVGVKGDGIPSDSDIAETYLSARVLVCKLCSVVSTDSKCQQRCEALYMSAEHEDVTGELRNSPSPQCSDKYTCDLCGISYAVKSDLIQHISMHGQEQTLSGNISGRSLSLTLCMGLVLPSVEYWPGSFASGYEVWFGKNNHFELCVLGSIQYFCRTRVLCSCIIGNMSDSDRSVKSRSPSPSVEVVAFNPVPVETTRKRKLATKKGVVKKVKFTDSIHEYIFKKKFCVCSALSACHGQSPIEFLSFLAENITNLTHLDLTVDLSRVLRSVQQKVSGCLEKGPSWNNFFGALKERSSWQMLSPTCPVMVLDWVDSLFNDRPLDQTDSLSSIGGLAVYRKQHPRLQKQNEIGIGECQEEGSCEGKLELDRVLRKRVSVQMVVRVLLLYFSTPFDLITSSSLWVRSYKLMDTDKKIFENAISVARGIVNSFTYKELVDFVKGNHVEYDPDKHYRAFVCTGRRVHRSGQTAKTSVTSAIAGAEESARDMSRKVQVLSKPCTPAHKCIKRRPCKFGPKCNQA